MVCPAVVESLSLRQDSPRRLEVASQGHLFQPKSGKEWKGYIYIYKWKSHEINGVSHQWKYVRFVRWQAFLEVLEPRCHDHQMSTE